MITPQIREALDDLINDDFYEFYQNSAVEFGTTDLVIFFNAGSGRLSAFTRAFVLEDEASPAHLRETVTERACGATDADASFWLVLLIEPTVTVIAVKGWLIPGLDMACPTRGGDA